MALEKYLVSDLGASISLTSGGTYTTISGINNIMFNVDTADVDTTTFDNNGWASRLAGIKTAGITLEGFRLTDPDNDYARDAGQKMVEKAQVSNSLRYWKIFLKADPTQYVMVAGYASGGSFGGGLNEATPWSVEVLVDGEPTFVGDHFDPDAV